MAGRLNASEVDDVFQSKRNTLDGTCSTSGRKFGFRCARGVKGDVGRYLDKGMICAVEPLDASQQRFAKFNRGLLARGKHLGHLDDAQICELNHAFTSQHLARLNV